MKQFKRRTGPGGGTRRLHHNYTVGRYTSVSSGHCRGRKQCSYDGAEIGSTGRIEEWSYRDVSAVPRTNKIEANENFALAA